MNVLPPSHTGVHEATYQHHGNAASLFYANTLLRAKKLRELMAKGAEILGISKTFMPHSLCAVEDRLKCQQTQFLLLG
jgi:hypothetical protein